MGVCLPKPRTDKISADGGDLERFGFRFGVSAMQGWRRLMEDAHLIIPELPCDNLHYPLAIFGVFDGHGGPAVSLWTATYFEKTFRDALKCTLDSSQHTTAPGELFIGKQKATMNNKIIFICDALERTFLALDDNLKKDDNRKTLRTIHEFVEEEERRHDRYEPRSAKRNKHFITNAWPGTPYGKLGSQENPEAVQYNRTPAHYPVPINGMISRNMMPPHNSFADGVSAEADDKTELYPLGREANINVSKQDPILPSHWPGSLQQETNEAGQTSTDIDAHKAEVNLSHAFDRMDSVAGKERLPLNRAPGGASMEIDEVGPAISCPSAAKTFGRKMHAYDPEICGSTAVVAVIIRDNPSVLVVANVGDSRAVLSRNGVAVALSQDHKPDVSPEKRRIRKAGGHVVNGRVDGSLSLSRAVGDLIFKQDHMIPPEQQKIIVVPDIRVIKLGCQDKFMLLACDGIWDCLTSQQAVDFVNSRLEPHATGKRPTRRLSRMCEDLCDVCFCEDPMGNEKGTGCDNMTTILVLAHFVLPLSKAITSFYCLMQQFGPSLVAMNGDPNVKDGDPPVSDGDPKVKDGDSNVNDGNAGKALQETAP